MLVLNADFIINDKNNLEEERKRRKQTKKLIFQGNHDKKKMQFLKQGVRCLCIIVLLF